MLAEYINKATTFDFQLECCIPLLFEFYCSNGEVQFLISPISGLVGEIYCIILPSDLCRRNIRVYLSSRYRYTGDINHLEIRRYGGIHS